MGRGACVHCTLKALAPLPDFEGVCYRGFPASDKADILRQYRKRRPIQWGAFTSTTTSIAAARRFAGAGGGDGAAAGVGGDVVAASTDELLYVFNQVFYMCVLYVVYKLL